MKLNKPYFVVKKAFTEEQCDFIRTFLGKPENTAEIGGGDIKKELRRTKIKWISHSSYDSGQKFITDKIEGNPDKTEEEVIQWDWLFDEISPLIEDAEKNHFKIIPGSYKTY